MGKSHLAILIPAYCEEKTIGNVVQEASKFGTAVVCDDGSTDNTVREATKFGAMVFSKQKNTGYEQTLTHGFRKCRTKGFKYIITIDADGEHDPSAISKFKVALLENDFDLVLGKRPQAARIGESFINALCQRLFRTTDILCGMKGYKLDSYPKSKDFDTKMLAGTELALDLISSGHNFTEVNVEGNPRSDQPRYGNVASANLKLLTVLWKIFYFYFLSLKK